MSAILLLALINPCYLRNLIQFLEQQYYTAANATYLDDMMPNILTLRGWSEILFDGAVTKTSALFFDYCSIFLGLLSLVGAIMLSRRDKLIFGAILLPVFLVILYFATRTPLGYYPIAKLTLTILPFVIGLVFVALSSVGANKLEPSIAVLKKLLSVFIVAAAAAGSVRYYAEVLNNEGSLSYVREPRFLNVCRMLEEIRNKRVLVFETDLLLTQWLFYHARHNDIYFDNRSISDSPATASSPFAKAPDLANVDFVATRDRVVDPRAPSVSGLTLLDTAPSVNWADGRVRCWLGAPTGLRFLALRPLPANLKLRFAPEPKATTFPIVALLADDQDYVSQAEIWGQNVDLRQMNFPSGFSTLRLLVTPRGVDPNKGPSFSVRAELDERGTSDLGLNPGR